MITGLVILISLIVGLSVGKIVYEPEPPKKLNPATVPIAELISGFEEYARLVEGGELSVEGDAALKLLKTHAEQKYLPAPAKTKKRNTFDGDDNNRKNDWCDMRCFEKEMAKASNDDERVVVIRRYMKKYRFNTTWQTWCIEASSSSDGRNYLRTMFDQQDQ